MLRLVKIVDASRLTDDEFAAALDLRQRIDRAWDPDITPTPGDELRLWFTVDEIENADHERLVAFEDGVGVAIGHLELTRDPANRKFAVIELEADGEDLFRAGPVLDRILDMAEADGRESIMAWGDLTDVRDRYLTDLGATRRLVDRDSDLLVRDVDADLMQQWVDARMERAADIELVGWRGVPPDEIAEAVVVTRNAMNDAPREEIEMEDHVWSVEDSARDARAWETLGFELHGMLAVDPAGNPAGMTTVLANTHRLDASWQGDTVVLEAYRRRGIGRWIKAAMWFHLREHLPDLPRLRTGNAESNDPMLAINVAMGFEPVHQGAAWQTDLATWRAGRARQNAPAG